MNDSPRASRLTVMVLLGLVVSCGGESPAEPTVPPLSITTTTLENAVQGVDYLQRLEATGGTAPYTWTISGGSLPPGLDLDPPTGSISGVAPVLSQNAFTVGVSSADGQSSTRDLSIGVYEPLVITTTSLPAVLQEVPYDVTLQAAGGDGDHTWSVTGGALPPGLVLNFDTGQLSGSPMAPGTSTPTFQVASGDGQTTQAALSITVDRHVLEPHELCSDYPAESIASFEDASLEAGVQTKSGIGVQGLMTCELLASMEMLPVENAGITSLVGMQNLVGLTQLGLGFNAISDLTPLAGLTSLETLFLHTNSIMDLTPLAGLTSLDLLWLGENQISDVSPLAGLTSLRTLLLLDNSITDITPLAGLTGLTSLRLDENPISDLSTVAGLTSLEHLVLGQLGITDIGLLSGLTNLVSLHLNSNGITDLSPLSGLNRLTQLNVAFNAVSDVGPLSTLTSLEELLLSGNPLSDLGPLAGLPVLRRLGANHTSVIDVGPLVGITSLENLDLTGNGGLSDIQPLLDNTGLGAGDYVWLSGTGVVWADISALEAKGVTVHSACP